MIYYQYSQHFNQLSQAILWAEKQKPALNKIGSKMFVRFKAGKTITTYTVFRSQCESDRMDHNMIAHTQPPKMLTFHEFVTRKNHDGTPKKADNLVIRESQLGMGVFV